MNQIGKFIKQVVPQEEVLRAAQAKIILKSWPAVVGDFLAERSWPDRYNRGTVWVGVESQAWAQELRMRKDQILSKLRAEGGNEMFVDIRFGVRAKKPDTIIQTQNTGKPEVNEEPECSIKAIAARRLADWPGPRSDR